MGAAGALFKVTRLATLSRLVASPSAGFWTRGIGAQVLASSLAFAVEAPAFTLGSHVAGSALGREQDYGHLGREIASSYLLLGGLRVAGVAANVFGAGIRMRPSQGGVQQGGVVR